MPETITVWLDDQIGITGQYLWLRKADGSLLNTGGDALADDDDTGLFAATLAESRTGLGTLRAVITGSSDPADAVMAGWLAESAALVSEELPEASGAGDAEQETLEEVLDVANSIATAIAGGSPVEPTGISMREQLTAIHEAIFPPDPDDSPLVITPDDPGRVTGFAVCYGLDGEAAGGIVVTYKLQSPPARDVGRILNGSTTGTRTSAENGLITFPGLFPGSTYYFTCGSNQVSITIPLDADSEAGYELPSFKKT